jgi:hypothetical protein
VFVRSDADARSACLWLVVWVLASACSSSANTPTMIPDGDTVDAPGADGGQETGSAAPRDAGGADAGNAGGPDACSPVPGAAPCFVVPAEPDGCARASCPPAGCATLAAAWDDLAAHAGRRCTMDADCTIVSGGNDTCETMRDREPIDGNCALVVSAAEFESSAMSRVADEYARLRCPWRKVAADCGQWQARCTNGLCQAIQLRGCLAPADAAAITRD